MISFIKGHVIEIMPEEITVDVHGVGYQVHTTPLLIDELKLNEERSFWIHTAVKEDNISLFGFKSAFDRSVFQSLLKVDRVGPKMAIRVMAGAPASKISEAIDAGDVATLCQLPRVGKKLAEQIVFKLKGKIVFKDKISEESLSNEKQKVHFALINLGFKAQEVEKVVDRLPQNVTVEEGVRQGLATLAGG